MLVGILIHGCFFPFQPGYVCFFFFSVPGAVDWEVTDEQVPLADHSKDWNAFKVFICYEPYYDLKAQGVCEFSKTLGKMLPGLILIMSFSLKCKIIKYSNLTFYFSC